MPRATGIHVIGGKVRAIEIRGFGKSAGLARAAEFHADPASDCFSADVRRGFSEHRLARDPAVLLLGAPDVRIRTLPVPFQKEDQIRRVLKTVLEEHVHGTSAEKVIVSFTKVCDVDADRSRIIALVAEKSAVSGAVSSMNSAGVDPQILEIDLSALFNWASFAGAIPAEGPGLVVDLEPDRIAVVISQDGRLFGMRSFRSGLGAAPPLPAEPDAPMVSPAGAAEEPASTVEAAGGLQPEPLQAGAPAPGPSSRTDETAAARVGREILRFIMAEGLKELPKSALATGSLSADASVLSEISARLGFALVQIPHPPGFEEAPPWAAMPAGAALKLLGHDATPMDLRQEEFAFRRKFDRVKWTAVALSFFFFLFFTALGANYQVRFTAERKKHARMVNETYQTFFRPALPQEKIQGFVDTGMREMRNALKTRMEKMTGKGADRDVPQIQSALTKWKEMSDRIRSAQGVKYLTVDRIVIEPRSFSIEGEADSPAALDSLLNMIKSTPGLDQARDSKPPKLEGERYRFGIRADVKEQEAPR